MPRASRTRVSRRRMKCGCSCWTRLTLLQDPTGSSLLAAPCSRCEPFPSVGPCRARGGSGRRRPASRQRRPSTPTPLHPAPPLGLPEPSETSRAWAAGRAPPSWSVPGCCREQSKLKSCGACWLSGATASGGVLSSGGASRRRKTAGNNKRAAQIGSQQNGGESSGVSAR